MSSLGLLVALKGCTQRLLPPPRGPGEAPLFRYLVFYKEMRMIAIERYHGSTRSRIGIMRPPLRRKTNVSILFVCHGARKG